MIILLSFISNIYHMEVVNVYLDLHECENKKKGGKTVWVLESETFKEPIELKIGYDNEELSKFNKDIENLDSLLERHDKRLIKLEGDNVNHELFREEFQNKIKNKQNQIDELRLELDKEREEKNSMYKTIADIKTAVEILSGTILQQQETIKQIQQKITKVPSVYDGSVFISGHKDTGLSLIPLSDGEYIEMMVVVVKEKNEFVTNEDSFTFNKITVSNGMHIPTYKLIGGTELDIPTATVDYHLVYIPC